MSRVGRHVALVVMALAGTVTASEVPPAAVPEVAPAGMPSALAPLAAPPEPMLAPEPLPAPSPTDEARVRRQTGQVMRDGTFLPFTLTPRIGDQRVSSLVLGGYDTSDGQGPRMSVFVEGALWSRVALRVGMSYLTVKGGTVGPSAGLRVAILRQEQQGVDLGVSVSYLNRGLPQPSGEPDGQIESLISLGGRVGRLGLFGNVAYTQGIDPKERNAQVRLAALYAIGDHLHVGLDARGYLELTDEHERDLEGVVSDFDVAAGPVVAYSFSHILVMAQVGGHVEQLRGASPHPAVGLLALGGVGTSF